MRRIVAIIGLALIGVFTVVLPIYLAKPDIWDGRIGILALYTGIFGVLFFLIIWLDNKAINRKRRMDEMSAAARAEYERNRKAKSKAAAQNGVSDSDIKTLNNAEASSAEQTEVKAEALQESASNDKSAI